MRKWANWWRSRFTSLIRKSTVFAEKVRFFLKNCWCRNLLGLCRQMGVSALHRILSAWVRDQESLIGRQEPYPICHWKRCPPPRKKDFDFQTKTAGHWIQTVFANSDRSVFSPPPPTWKVIQLNEYGVLALCKWTKNKIQCAQFIFYNIFDLFFISLLIDFVVVGETYCW